ncbi:MAG: HEPN domain-containing protein [Planktothrix sp.]
MNRQNFQELALIRLQEAKVLLDNHQYSGAYYLSGYVIECALKACIAKKTQQFDFPDLKSVRKIYTHDLKELAELAGYDIHAQLKSTYKTQWSIIKVWSEESRYQTHNQQEARDIYSAITDPNHGVLKWLQQHW